MSFAMKQFSLCLVKFASILALILAAGSSAVLATAPVSTTQHFKQTSTPASGVPTPTILPNGLVDIGGRRLWFQCVGKGTPTVILEAGQGDTSYNWIKVQTGGDGSYRVCSYDRANLGESDAAPKPRTYLDMARDLHALLTNAYIEGPYILVGHSGGGLLIRVFRDQYPEEVAGLVLVDAAHPDMGQRLLEGLPPKTLFESKALREWRIWLSYMSDSQGSAYQDQEGLDTKANNALVKAAKPLRDLPLVVISRSPDNATFEGAPILPAVTNAKLRQIWQELQSELVGLSSNSTHIVASHAGHSIQREEPELVIDAIRKLVDAARDPMGVTGSPGEPADQTDAAHTPRILGVADRQLEMRDGQLILHKDIIFTDEAGDAVFDEVRLVSADPPGDYFVAGGYISVSSEEQKDEAMDPQAVACPSLQTTFVIEVQIVDQAYNRSEPVLVTFNCPASKVHSNPSLIIGLVIGLALLGLVIWLLVRYLRSKRMAASIEKS
jgi:pimeloyl-ACP methyl ester carboxylesterase